MIIKDRDPLDLTIARLEALMSLPGVTPDQRRQLKAELDNVRKGDKGERDAAFYLDPHIKDHRGRVILHDLCIEHDGEFAQIDHLLINRQMDFYILESKNFRANLKINERGEFERFNGKFFEGMKSPIEQAKRQGRILLAMMKARDLLPKRLGFTIQPKIIPYVLIGEKCSVQRAEGFDSDCVVKVDHFMRDYQASIDKDESTVETFTTFAKIVAKDTIIALGQALADAHQPKHFNFAAKYGITISLDTAQPAETAEPAVAEAPAPYAAQPARARRKPAATPAPVATPAPAAPAHPATAKRQPHWSLAKDKTTPTPPAETAAPGTAQGHCIRCATPIPFKPKVPYCKPCYKLWAKNDAKSYTHPEPHCHSCGTPTPQTYARPLCGKCYGRKK